MAQCVGTKGKKKKKVVGGMGSGLVGVHLKDELLCEKLVNSRRGSPSRVIKCQSIRIRIQKGKFIFLLLLSTLLC